jgi:hypothetical protein
MLVVATLAGCSRFYVDWDTRTIRRTPDEIAKPVVPAASPTRIGTVAPPPQNATVRRRKHKHPAASADVKEMSIQPDTTQTSPLPPSTPTSTISMATPGASSDAAEKEIEAAVQRLAHFDRNQLSGPTLATYDQANGFLSQGKQALEEQDYVAASGFAQKASVLTDKLQATQTAH